MSSTPHDPLDDLRARRQRLIAEVGFVIHGSILERFSRCGSPGCARHHEPPRLHGPYWQWTAKIKGKTVTRNLNDQQLARYREWMANAQHLDQLAQQLFETSAEADAILRDRERAPRIAVANTPATITRRSCASAASPLA